ncbi:major facilitator superfamily domain-containing protein [Irpex rosettiformis]|uniref:Major facilitator superfamily domain-containing protein n=1 Tax=Irpex rosettiformis TaxID=378272 RepID=A0ACB8TRR6_9APHY|nr:major facilitator superfamily domain-containing protein [Irpex rosettiformis]
MQRKLRDAGILVTVCCVTVLSVFISGATGVSIATIGKDLDFKQEDLQWPLNVYALSNGCLLLLCGRLADIFGSRRMFLIGSLWFSIWSIAAALAPNSPSFIIFLGLLGIGVATITPAGISIISSHFPPGPERGRAFAWLGAGQPVGYIIGLILGGILSDSTASWRTIFWLEAGLAALLCVMGWFVLPADDTSKRYTRGLDWIGAFLSTAGLALLVYDLAESTTTPKGWATPFIPSLLGTSIILIIGFVLWELRREAKGESVLLPMSMWTQPGAKMGSTILLVFFGWWAFNTLGYYLPLFYQEVQLYTPIQTAVHLVPIGVAEFITNVVTGYLVSRVPGQLLVLFGVFTSLASSIIFGLIKIETTYWGMAFGVSILLPVLDIAYTVSNIQVCSAFPEHSQALAGSIFSVSTRLGTSIGLAVTSTVANTISEKYNKRHPELPQDHPLVLLAGFRAAGWVCCGVLGLSALITVVGWRGVGLVGQSAGKDHTEKLGSTVKPRITEDIELGVIAPVAAPPLMTVSEVGPSVPASSAVSVNIDIEEISPGVKKDGGRFLE